MTGSSHNPPSDRPVTVMLARGNPLPASVEIKDENGRILQRYAPVSLHEAERAMMVNLIKAVKLSLFCFNSHWPSQEPMRHFQADVMERLTGVRDRAEALLGEKVVDPPPPRRIVPPFRLGAIKNDRDGD